jgi:hypothetical protein
MKRKIAFLDWRLRLQTSRIYRFPAIPGRKRRGGKPPLPGLAPESALRLRPRRALSSAPVSTSVGGQPWFAKRVVVADGRVDSRLLLPTPKHCLIKMLPVEFRHGGRQNREATEFGNQT